MGYTECTRILVTHKSIEINDMDANNSSPLHKAAFNGHLTEVKLLIGNAKFFSKFSNSVFRCKSKY